MQPLNGLPWIITALFFAAWAAVLVPWTWYALYVVPRSIRRWEEVNGCRILQKEARAVFKGPFSWHSTNIQLTYRVTVCDKANLVSQGWIRVGRPWLVTLSVKRCPVEARWDESGPLGHVEQGALSSGWDE